MNNPEGRGERPARTLGTKKICIIRDTLSNDKKKDPDSSLSFEQLDGSRASWIPRPFLSTNKGTGLSTSKTRQRCGSINPRHGGFLRIALIFDLAIYIIITRYYIAQLELSKRWFLFEIN